MKLLVVNHYAGGPRLGMEYRPHYLAHEWVRAGHRVQIVGATFSHLRTRQPAAGDEVIDGVAYRWLPTPAYDRNGVARARNIAAFLSRLWQEAPRLARDFAPDVVVASSTYPLDIWVARRLARLAGAKLVYEVHDLWPASPIELGGMSPRHPFIRLCQKAEDDACRDADVVISMLPKVADHLAAHGLDLRKLHIVPNGISVDEWQGEPGHDRLPGPGIEQLRRIGHVAAAALGAVGRIGHREALGFGPCGSGQQRKHAQGDAMQFLELHRCGPLT